MGNPRTEVPLPNHTNILSCGQHSVSHVVKRMRDVRVLDCICNRVQGPPILMLLEWSCYESKNINSGGEAEMERKVPVDHYCWWWGVAFQEHWSRHTVDAISANNHVSCQCLPCRQGDGGCPGINRCDFGVEADCGPYCYGSPVHQVVDVVVLCWKSVFVNTFFFRLGRRERRRTCE